MYMRSLYLLALFASALAEKAAGDPSLSLGILSMITPAVQPKDVPAIDAYYLSSNALVFFDRYTSDDEFNFRSYIEDVQDGPDDTSLVSHLTRLITLYYKQHTFLLDAPDDYLSSMRSQVTVLPSATQDSVMSQATALINAYKSLATENILHEMAATGVAAASEPSAPTMDDSDMPPAQASPRSLTDKIAGLDPKVVAVAAVGAISVIGIALL